MGERLAGVTLFLPVPIVLWLLTWAPMGADASIALGVALTLTHRAYARPFVLARSDRRCLWCGGSRAAGPRFGLQEPFGATDWRACSVDHAGRLGAVLGWAARHSAFLRFGIIGTLAVFLPAALLAHHGRLGPTTAADAVAFFRLGIAATVLPLGWLGPRGARAAPDGSSVPFPVHIQALVGTRAVVWLFRLVGLWWLAQGAVHVAARLRPLLP